MYKVNYYTLGLIKRDASYDVGNIKQYSDTLYTIVQIEDIPEFLQQRLNQLKGDNKYNAVITNIQEIKGHV